MGAGHPVAILGALNTGADSFHAGSVHPTLDALTRAAEAMVRAGAALLDIGVRSTAPYGARQAPSPVEEAERLAAAVARVAGVVDVPVSADTARLEPARAALDAGAAIVNDVGGLRGEGLAALVASRGASLIVGASPPAARRSADPVEEIARLLEDALLRARAAGVDPERVVLDPGIGFFRGEALAWHAWDMRVLAGLGRLARLGRPLAVGCSRKSFLGALTGRGDPGERLAGSLAAAALAVLVGASVVRTHDVAETVDAVRVAEAWRAAGAP